MTTTKTLSTNKWLSKWVKLVGALLLILFVPMLLSSCAPKPTDNPQSSKSESSNNLRLTGSDTMVHLTTQWAEDYMKVHPKANLAVNGGGSGNGIAALLNNSTDIAPASRDIKSAEQDTAKKNKIQLKKTAVAIDAIAIVVNKDNPINALSLEDLHQIYTGKSDNWKAFHGPDKHIIPFSRESSSGTYEFFQEHVLKKEDYATQARLIPSTIAIIETVAQDKWSIGYVGLGYALNAQDKIKIIAIAPQNNKPAVTPNTKTVRSGQYPIARELYLISTPKLKQTKFGLDFMHYCLSEKGQQVVENAGFLPLPKPGGHNGH